MSECYICTGKCTRLSPCACKERYVHLACLVKMINTSHKNYCPVCLTTFNHIKTTKKNRICENFNFFISLSLSILCSSLLLISLLMFDGDWKSYLFSIILFAFFCIIATTPMFYVLISVCCKDFFVYETTHVTV